MAILVTQFSPNVSVFEGYFFGGATPTINPLKHTVQEYLFE